MPTPTSEQPARDLWIPQEVWQRVNRLIDNIDEAANDVGRFAANRFRTLGADSESSESSPESTPKSVYTQVKESICGHDDDSEDVEIYGGLLGVSKEFVKRHSPSVCQFQWQQDLNIRYTSPGNVSGVRWGTGTIVGKDLVLTCGHLFDQNPTGWQVPRVNGTEDKISPADIANSMKVNFNYQFDPLGNPREEDGYDVVELLEYRLNGLDMALCRVSGSPGDKYNIATISSENASTNDIIAIIGHPAGVRKRIEAGRVSGLSDSQIRYNDIDTLGGNSGSGIISAKDGLIVGVHTNGGCQSAGFNYGLPIKTFIQASPILTSLLN